MNEETGSTYEAIMGVSAGGMYSVFAWILFVSLVIMVMIVAKNGANRRLVDKDYDDTDLIITILRAVALLTILIIFIL